MTEVEEWIWKHYTKENSDSVKCNYCGKVLFEIFLSDPTHYLIFHLWDEHNITELDEHPERDNIQQNYKILKWKMMAVCNHCQKTVNFAIHGVHVLTIHLKIKHADKYNLGTIERRLSMDKSLDKLNKLKVKKRNTRVWAMYDEVDDTKVRCKACNRHIKKSKKRTALLYSHLRHCFFFKSYDPIKLRESSMWDKFDQIDDKYVSCKGCKKPVKKYYISITKLNHHLFSCLGISKKLKVKQRKSKVWSMYDEVDDNHISCKGCKKTLKIKKYSTSYLYQHLNFCPNSSDKVKEKKESVWDKYDKVDENQMRCKGYKDKINLGLFSISKLNKHLHICPSSHTESEDLCEASMKLKAKTKVNLRKRRIEELNVDESSHTESEDLCEASMKSKAETKVNLRKRRIKKLNVDESFSSSDTDRKIWEILKKAKEEAIMEDSRRKETNVDVDNKLSGKMRKLGVWDMFDEVDDNYVSCKGCKKTLKLSGSDPSSNLNTHLNFCPDKPNKLRFLRQITSDVRDMFDEVDGIHVSCKGCKKTIKGINLYQHSYYCPNSSYKEKKKVKVKKESIWDKYDEVDENQMRCKGCKDMINLGLFPIPNLKKHLYICPSYRHTKSEDLCEASMKSKAKTKDNLRKRRIEELNVDESSSLDSDRKVREILKKTKSEAIQDSRRKKKKY